MKNCSNRDELVLYLDSMFPDRYEFQEEQLIIYYPEVVIKNLIGLTHTIREVYIHLPYDSSMFKFSKLRYSVNEYVNERNDFFIHSHIKSEYPNLTFTANYCLGNIENIKYYDINDGLSIIACINSIDFWLHNENSRDCYYSLASISTKQANSILNCRFSSILRDYISEPLFKEVKCVNTIFGTSFQFESDNEELIKLLQSKVYNTIANFSDDLRKILQNPGRYHVVFKGKKHYLTFDAIDMNELMKNNYVIINEDIVEQLKTLTNATINEQQFYSSFEEYCFNSIF